MATYRKKPVEVEAFQYGVDSMPAWFTCSIIGTIIFMEEDDDELIHHSLPNMKTGVYCNLAKTVAGEAPYCLIETLEGSMKCEKGDFIIQSVHGEMYPCKPDIFAKTYYKVYYKGDHYEQTHTQENKR